jgi:two-component system, chemotaxis family, sensor kinase CheA
MSKDPYRYFRVEAKEIVEQLSRGVLDLEQGASGKELVGKMLRLAHTLKGAAHVVKQAEIARMAHQLEDILVAYQSGDAVPRQQAEAMLGLVDGMATQLAALGLEQSQQVEHPAPAPPEETFETLRVDLGDMDVLLEGLAESGVWLSSLKTKLAAVEHTADLAVLLLSHLSAPAADVGGERAAASLRKGRAIAEDLQTMLSPLSHNLVSAMEQVERELAQVRDTASQLRLVPASAVFAPLRRTARNTAQTLGKQVDFVTDGGEHRLDAHVLAAVRDALLQIVRNAVAHGIEAPEVRAAAGKPALGKVSLQVHRRGNRVAFACQDDGGGFDVAALRRAVVTRGLVSPAAAEALSSEDVFRLLLRGGGISTSSAVTEMAGRGIGLDVVREASSKLKAEVAMRTAPGGGSTVEISVPVSLLSLSAVIVESGGMSASLPLDSVQQTLRLVETDVVRSPDGDSILFDGKTVPFLPLARALGQTSSRGQAAQRFSAVVVRSGAERAAIGVDRVLSTATVLLRPIPAFAGVDPIVAGAALDAEGNPQLVLDPAALVLAAGATQVISVQEAPPRTPLVLVIDDSLTTRMLEQSILETAGYEVHLATSAEEALEKALTADYDLFVVDVEMPGMDGFEFVARARSTPALSQVPAILVTSRNSPQDKKRGEEAGARAYVVKGEFDQAQLLQTIRRLIGLHIR